MAVAEEKIKFTIASIFKGEGLQKATKAVGTLGKNTAKAASGIAAITSQLGQMDGTVGKVAGGIGNFMPLMSTWVGVLAAAAIGVVKLHKEMQALAEMNGKAKAAMSEQGQELFKVYGQLVNAANAHKEMEERVKADAQAALDWANTEKKAVKEVEDAYKALAAAEGAVKGAQSELAITKITNEFNAKLRKAANELDKGVIEAEKALAVSQLQAAAAIDKASDAADGAREALVSLDQKIEAQKKVIDATAAAGKDCAAAESELAKLENDRQAQVKRVEAADLALESERLKAKDAEAEHITSLEKLKRANEEAKEKREEAAQLELDYAEELSNTKQAASDRWNAQQRQIEATEARAAQALAAQERSHVGMAADQKYHQGISGKGYTYSTDANGNIDNFIDWERANRYAGRAERDAQWGERRNASSAARMEKIRDRMRRGDKVSDRDKQRLKDWDAFNDAKKTKSEWQQAVDDLKGQQQKTLTDLDKSLAEIKSKFEKMGIK